MILLATPFLIAGEDYNSFPTFTVTISAGTGAGETITAPILLFDDNVFEPTETFSISFIPNPRIETVEGQATATIFIIDNDGTLKCGQYMPIKYMLFL